METKSCDAMHSHALNFFIPSWTAVAENLKYPECNTH